MTPAPEEVPDRVADAARWFYRGIWRGLVDWFRVPADAPALPVEPGETPESFRPDPGLLDYFRFWFWVVVAIVALAIAVGWIAIAVALPWAAILLLPLALVGVFGPGLIAYVAVHLRYDTTWYVMSKRSLRLRRGVWLIHEMTITFENVQNVKVEQGPIERFFNIGNLVIETAGGGSDSSKKGFAIGNRAVIEGVADTQRLRDHILANLQSSRATGLGDEAPEMRAAWTPEHVAVLREIREATEVLSRG